MNQRDPEYDRFGPWVIEISDEDLAARLADWQPTHERPESGYAWLHQAHVEGADTGADLDFLKGCRGAPSVRPAADPPETRGGRHTPAWDRTLPSSR